MWSCAPSHGKWNKIIKSVLAVKLWEEIGFLQDPQKAYIVYAIRFIYVFQKKSRNKLSLERHDTYILFRMFISHVSIKWFFFFIVRSPNGSGGTGSSGTNTTGVGNKCTNIVQPTYLKTHVMTHVKTHVMTHVTTHVMTHM